MAVPVLAYHQVGTGPQASITWVSQRAFERQIQYLADDGYVSLTLRDLRAGHPPPTSRAVVLTFDDAYISVAKHAFPVLRRHGFVATLFVIAGYVGQENGWDVRLPGMRCRHLSWAKLRELVQAGWEIGSHTMTHPDLTALPPHTAWQELRDSKLLLEQELNTAVTSLSFPFGRYDRATIRLAVKAGYQCACTLDGRPTPLAEAPGFLVPRWGVYLFDHLGSFRRKVGSARFSPAECWKQRLIHQCAQGTWWAKSLLRR